MTMIFSPLSCTLNKSIPSGEILLPSTFYYSNHRTQEEMKERKWPETLPKLLPHSFLILPLHGIFWGLRSSSLEFTRFTLSRKGKCENNGWGREEEWGKGRREWLSSSSPSSRSLQRLGGHSFPCWSLCVVRNVCLWNFISNPESLKMFVIFSWQLSQMSLRSLTNCCCFWCGHRKRSLLILCHACTTASCPQASVDMNGSCLISVCQSDERKLREKE